MSESIELAGVFYPRITKIVYSLGPKGRSKSLRTTIPEEIVAKLELTAGDELVWELAAPPGGIVTKESAVFSAVIRRRRDVETVSMSTSEIHIQRANPVHVKFKSHSKKR